MITNATTSVLSAAAATTGINGAGPGSDADKNTQTKMEGTTSLKKKKTICVHEKITIQDVQGKGKIKVFLDIWLLCPNKPGVS